MTSAEPTPICPTCSNIRSLRGRVTSALGGLGGAAICWDKFHDQADSPDMVNHPPHYGSDTLSGIECIDAIEAASTRDEFTGFLKGQVLKYAWRFGRKGRAVEDAKKAAWYLDRLVKHLEKK